MISKDFFFSSKIEKNKGDRDFKSERKILHRFWQAFYKYNEKLMKLSLKLKSAVQSLAAVFSNLC